MCGAVFVPSRLHPLLSTVYQCDRCLSCQGMEAQVLPAIGAISIVTLAANSGSPRMSQAPNLRRVTQLFTVLYFNAFLSCGTSH